MNCQKCGIEIPDDSIFCPSCGSKQEMIQTPREQANVPVQAQGKAKKAYVTAFLGLVIVVALVALIIKPGKKDNGQPVVQNGAGTEYKEQSEPEQTVLTDTDAQETEGENIDNTALPPQVTEVTIAGTVYSTNVEVLDLQNNGVMVEDADVKELIYFTNLKELNISGNPITNLDFVKDMKQLKKLTAYECNISDISVLADKTELEEINLNSNPITDLTPLQNCQKLRFVCFGNSKLSSLDVLSDKSELETISLYGCGITDLSFLNIKDKPKLKYLYLGDDPITSVEALKGANLVDLSLTNTLIAQNPESFEGITVNRNFEAWGCNLTQEDVQIIESLVQGDYVLSY